MPNERLLKLSILLVLLLGLAILSSSCASSKAREDVDNYRCNVRQIDVVREEITNCLKRTWSPSQQKRQAYCTNESVKSACTFKGDL